MHVTYIYSTSCGKLKGFDSTILEDIIEKILQYFPKLKDIHSILYFGNSFSFRNIGATIYPIDYPNSGLRIEHLELVPICQQYTNLDFVIYFYRVVTGGDILARVINISHEFQHASQYTLNKKIYFYGCIIRYMLDNIIAEVISPVEYDAIRKSKIIACNLCGNNAVNRMTERMLSNPQVPREFWEVFKSIDVEKEYNLENNIFRLWEAHKIEEKIQELIIIKNINSNQKNIIEMYNFANSY